jgi:hypothetical protein
VTGGGSVVLLWDKFTFASCKVKKQNRQDKGFKKWYSINWTLELHSLARPVNRIIPLWVEAVQ